MQFIVTGYDGTDEGASARRRAAHPAHLDVAVRLHAAGRWLCAMAILDNGGATRGSLVVCDFPSRRALEEEWLRHEPYLLDDVWQRVEIRRAQVWNP